MSAKRPATEVFEQEFLPIRAKLLEVAAALDRLDRASGALDSEARRARIDSAIDTLSRAREDRAEQIQLIFSREYDDDWRETMKVD